MKRFTILVIFVLFLCVGCKKDNRAGFEMFYSQSFVIPPAINTFESHSFILRNIPLDTARYFAANGIKNSNEIASIEPWALKLSTIFGNFDFNFVRDVSVQICNECLTTSPASDAVEIFYRGELLQNNRADLDLIPNDIDVKKYFLKNKLNLKVRMVLWTSPAQSLETRADIRFKAILK